ncbi:MAG: hypothetical protein IPN33_05940 [Saprospiraceae bacterium]|nr:hypothetical protein [Saprospiraceae bacterium]
MVIAVLFVFTYNALAQSPVNKVWHTSFGEPLASFDWTASAADAAGNVYTTGNTRLSNDKIAAYTTKHDSLGNLVWDQEFQATGIDASYGVAIQLDGSGNVYIAGAAYSASSLHFDFLVIKYENDGDQVWYATRNGTGNGDDYASALIVDGAQNVYVTGPSKGSGYADGLHDPQAIRQRHDTLGQALRLRPTRRSPCRHSFSQRYHH